MSRSIESERCSFELQSVVAPFRVHALLVMVIVQVICHKFYLRLYCIAFIIPMRIITFDFVACNSLEFWSIQCCTTNGKPSPISLIKKQIKTEYEMISFFRIVRLKGSATASNEIHIITIITKNSVRVECIFIRNFHDGRYFAL